METVLPRSTLSQPAALLFLFAAIIVYALFGSPTPDNPGIVEAVIGALLAASVCLSGVPRAFAFSIGRSAFLKCLQVFFLTGLILPSVAGAYFGNDRMLIVRDLLAFAFLGLPLFLTDKLRLYERSAEILRRLLVFAGIAFCARTLVPAFNIWIDEGELLYLSNSPLALFAAVYLAGRLWVSLESISKLNVITVLLCLAALAVLIAAMLLDVQRATIGAVFATWAVMAVSCALRHPRRLVLPVLLIGALAAALYPVLSEAVHAMAEKTAEVGLNARAAEARAVFAALLAYPPSLFAGLGWGSVFASPAVAGLNVNYTHSFLTTMALKGGLMLLFLAGLTVLAALYQIYAIFQRDRVRGLVLFWGLVIPVFLYASHKSLDFGLLLLMIGVWSVDPGALHKAGGSGKTERTAEEEKV